MTDLLIVIVGAIVSLVGLQIFSIVRTIHEANKAKKAVRTMILIELDWNLQQCLQIQNQVAKISYALEFEPELSLAKAKEYVALPFVKFSHENLDSLRAELPKALTEQEIWDVWAQYTRFFNIASVREKLIEADQEQRGHNSHEPGVRSYMN